MGDERELNVIVREEEKVRVVVMIRSDLNYMGEIDRLEGRGSGTLLQT